MPDWTTGQPAYQQVADILRAAIRSGEIKEGESLPSLAELMREHEVSITVAREAIRLLRTEGLVTSHQGKGAFVLPGAQAKVPQGNELAALRAEFEDRTAKLAAELEAMGARLARLEALADQAE